MRYVMLSEDEVQEIKKLHESLLSKSSHGLFHSVGKILGESIIKEITDDAKFFDEAARILKERKIVEEVSFDSGKVTARGCIEIKDSDSPTCDVMRGIIVALYRAHLCKTIYCEETACESNGADRCIFEIRTEVI
jgi:predicted hydrocarbon binding protein